MTADDKTRLVAWNGGKVKEVVEGMIGHLPHTHTRSYSTKVIEEMFAFMLFAAGGNNKNEFSWTMMESFEAEEEEGYRMHEDARSGLQSMMLRRGKLA